MSGFLLLRLEAPLMAFGGPAVDYIGPTRRFPGQAQIAGLLGNALGYRHRDSAALGSLQARLRMAAAMLRPGELLRDYQTVDLGLPHLAGTGWTTRGTVESRAGASSTETHIRHRWHLADALVLVALTLEPATAKPLRANSAGEPGLDDLAAALDHPARPLFIGRKPCLPTTPLRLGLLEAATAEAALQAGIVLLHRTGTPMHTAVEAEFDARLAELGDRDEEDRLVDRRDWRNQMHLGERAVLRRRLPAAAGMDAPG